MEGAMAAEEEETVIQARNERVNFLAGLACLNSVALGFQIGAVSAAVPLIKDEMDLSSFQLEMYEATISIAAIFGAIFAGFVSEPLGRLWAFRIASYMFILGSLVQATCANYAMLMIGVFIIGVAVGFGLAVDPIYIAEISPAGGRGYFVTWSEIAITGGQLVGFVIGLLVMLVFTSWNGAWRLIIGFGIVVPISLLVAIAWVLPESPRWLAIHDRPGEAMDVLKGLGWPEAKAKAILDDIAADHGKDSGIDASLAGLWSAIYSLSSLKPAVRRILVVGVGAALAQQLSGIDALFYNFIFSLEAVGIEKAWRQYLILVGVGIVKLATAVLSMYFLDSMGRRPLVVFSAFGTAASLGMLSIAYAWHTSADGDGGYETLIVLLYYAYIFLFELGLGPGCWLIPSEIFFNSIRMRAMTIATFANRCATTGVVITGISIVEAWSWSGFFGWYCAFSSLAAVFLLVYLPETKGRTLEQMYAHFEMITGGSGTPMSSLVQQDAESASKVV